MSVRVRLSSFAVIVALGLTLTPGPGVQAQAEEVMEEEARIHFLAGRVHYERGAFLQAAGEFEAAYRVSRHPKLLYNAYLAYRDGDALADATRALEEYLQVEAVIENRQQLEARLGVLKARQAEGGNASVPPVPPAPAATAIEPSSPVAAVPAADPGATGGAGSSVLGWVLLGSGAALALGSIPTFLVAGSASTELDALCPADKCPADVDRIEAQDLDSRETTFTAVSYSLLFSGIAAAGVGTVLLLAAPGGDSGQPPSASLGCHAHGCYGAVRLGF